MKCNACIHLLILYFTLERCLFTSGASTRHRKKDDKLLILGKEVEGLRRGQEDLMKELSQLRQDIKLIKTASDYNFPLDCNAAKLRGDWRSVQRISPPGLNVREVRCDQTTSGGGWTVVVRRVSKFSYISSLTLRFGRHQRKNIASNIISQHENFNRSWTDYKFGFGSPFDEYWIGNEVIHALTNDGPWEAAVILKHWDGSQGEAYWDSFRVSEEQDNFRLELSGYRSDRSDVEDGLTYHNGRSFSTEDADNDEYATEHCARKYGGGWWFHQCHVSHLTGSHLEPGSSGEHALHWLPWKGDKESLKYAVLMIRPKLNLKYY